MIKFAITIQTNPQGRLVIHRDSPGGSGTVGETALAEALRVRFDELSESLVLAAGQAIEPGVRLALTQRAVHPLANSVNQEWRRFFAACHPGEVVPEVQYDETKRAFFAGAFSMFTMMSNVTKSDSEVMAVAFAEKLLQELIIFQKSLPQPKA